MVAATNLAPTLYQQLNDLPVNLVGEIINGRLYTQPRPAGPHALTSSALGMDLGGPFQFGRGGPGGWWIIDEPELHFVHDTEVVVPDLAGWRRERLPAIPRHHRFNVVPDWVCEIVSPSTVRQDRIIKMPLYARYGVQHLWLIDPVAQTLEVFQLDQGCWSLIGLYQQREMVQAPPFEVIDLDLADLWVDDLE
jgi:Uma2 family endonuclease